jgi:HAMP domain
MKRTLLAHRTFDKAGRKHVLTTAVSTGSSTLACSEACATAANIGVSLGYLLLRRVLNPLSKMTEVTEKIAEGDYTARVSISSRDELNRLAEKGEVEPGKYRAYGYEAPGHLDHVAMAQARRDDLTPVFGGLLLFLLRASINPRSIRHCVFSF